MCITHPLPLSRGELIKHPQRKNKKLSETPCPSVVKKRKQHHKLKTTVKNGKE
jgi:hypothetical protein